MLCLTSCETDSAYACQGMRVSLLDAADAMLSLDCRIVDRRIAFHVVRQLRDLNSANTVVNLRTSLTDAGLTILRLGSCVANGRLAGLRLAR